MVYRGVLQGGTVTVDISPKGEFTFEVKKGGKTRAVKVPAAVLAA